MIFIRWPIYNFFTHVSNGPKHEKRPYDVKDLAHFPSRSVQKHQLCTQHVPLPLSRFPLLKLIQNLDWGNSHFKKPQEIPTHHNYSSTAGYIYTYYIYNIYIYIKVYSICIWVYFSWLYIPKHAVCCLCKSPFVYHDTTGYQQKLHSFRTCAALLRKEYSVVVVEGLAFHVSIGHTVTYQYPCWFVITRGLLPSWLGIIISHNRYVHWPISIINGMEHVYFRAIAHVNLLEGDS